MKEINILNKTDLSKEESEKLKKNLIPIIHFTKIKKI